MVLFGNDLSQNHSTKTFGKFVFDFFDFFTMFGSIRIVKRLEEYFLQYATWFERKLDQVTVNREIESKLLGSSWLMNS